MVLATGRALRLSRQSARRQREPPTCAPNNQYSIYHVRLMSSTAYNCCSKAEEIVMCSRKLVLRIESLSMQMVPHVQQLESSTGNGDAAESPPYKDEKSSCRDEDLEALQDDEPLQVVVVGQTQQALPNPQASATTTLSTPQALGVLNQTLGLLQDRCSIPCCCRCHVSKPVSYTPTRWARSLVGSLMVSFNRQLSFKNSTKCTEASCKNRTGTSITVEYQFPVWLCSRAVQMQTLVGATTGLRVSLRPARILPFGSNFWLATDSDHSLSSTVTVQQWMLHYGNVFPGDTDPDGVTALEVSLLPVVSARTPMIDKADSVS